MTPRVAARCHLIAFVRKNTTRKSEFIQLTLDTIHPIEQASVSGLAGKILVMFKSLSDHLK
jgi:hypothetical protein